MADHALQLLEKYQSDYSEPEQRPRHRLHIEMALAELSRRGYIGVNCTENLRYARRVIGYRRSLLRLLRETREQDLRREILRELWLTLSILASIWLVCGDYAEGDVKAALVDAVQRFNARFEQCYRQGNPYTCVDARLEPMLEGARNPHLILSLLNSRRGRRRWLSIPLQ